MKIKNIRDQTNFLCESQGPNLTFIGCTTGKQHNPQSFCFIKQSTSYSEMLNL